MPWQISVHAGLLALISICVPLAAPGSTASDGYALKGTLVTPTEIVEGGTKGKNQMKTKNDLKLTASLSGLVIVLLALGFAATAVGLPLSVLIGKESEKVIPRASNFGLQGA